MSIEAQDLLVFSDLDITEAMELAAAQHKKTQTNAIEPTEENDWTHSRSARS